MSLIRRPLQRASLFISSPISRLSSNLTSHTSIKPRISIALTHRPISSMSPPFPFSASSLTSKQRIRMLVLETDEPHPDTHNEKGSFGEIFDGLFKKAGDGHEPPLGVETVMRFIVESEGGKIPRVEELEGVKAVLITGSMYDAHGDDEWILKLIKLLKELWVKRPDMRFSGVCFGHQILCRTLGGTVESHPGKEWELAHTPIKLTSIGKQLFRTSSDTLSLHQMHQDHVTTPPSPSTTSLLKEGEEVHVWGSSEHTQVQGVYVKDRLFTTQGHLGFDEAMVKRQIEMRVESGGIEERGTAEEGKEKACMEHDGEVVAAGILRLFHGEDGGIE